MRSEQPTIEQLFAATRALERKGGAGTRRLRGNVASRLAAAGVGIGGQALAGKIAVGANVGLSALKGKVVIGLAVLGVAAAGATSMLQRSTSDVAVAGDRPYRQIRLLPHLSQFPLALHVEAVRPATPMRVQLTEPAAQPSKTLAQSTQDALAAELVLVRGAQSQLANGHAESALKILDLYFQRFSSGILRPEAKVTHLRALCMAGRKADAEREATRFARSDPDSPLAGSLHPCNPQ